MPRHPKDTEFEAVMQRVFALSHADQLRAFAALGDYLSGDPSARDIGDQQLERRARALAAMRAVADHLKLDAGDAPGVRQFNEARQVLGIGFTASYVVKAFGSWDQAKRALTGGRVSETPAQRARRVTTSGRRWSYHDPVHALRLWLATDPPRLHQTDYAHFAASSNEALGEGEMKLPLANAIKDRVALPWHRLISVAKGEISLADALDAVADTERRSGPLITHRGIAALYGRSLSMAPEIVSTPGFPPVVAHLGASGLPTWLRRDVEEFKEKGRHPSRREGELQDQVVTVEYLTTAQNVRPVTIWDRVRNRDWARCPAPDGRTANLNYWWRERVDRWLAASTREQRIEIGSPVSGGPMGREKRKKLS